MFRLPVLLCAGAMAAVGLEGVGDGEAFTFADTAVPATIRSEAPPGLAGTLAFFFILDGVESTLAFPHLAAGRGYTEGTLAQLPFGRAWFFFGAGGGGINLAWENESGEEIVAQMSLSHLKGGQPYHLTIAWDFGYGNLRMWLNGVEQGDLLHSRATTDLRPNSWENEISVGGRLTFEEEDVARMGLACVEAFGHALSDAAVRDLLSAHPLPSLEGEGRTVFHEPMRLHGLQRKLIYETTFSGKETWVHESDLLDEEGKRASLPPKGAWILEGDAVKRRQVPEGVHFVSSAPDDGRNGAWVFWLNRELPEPFLIEYAYTPERAERGLNILFFNARGSDGGSIFDSMQPTRHGWFRSYIVGEIDNYHVSPWATDGTEPRRTANLRKNSGFRLLAAGNDRLAGTGQETHLVRVAKIGSRIELESNGILALRHEDGGTVYGPVLSGGIAGLRFMAHTGSATVHFFRIYQLTPNDNKTSNEPH